MTDVKGNQSTRSAPAQQRKRECNAVIAALNTAAAALPPLGYYSFLARQSWSDLDSADAVLKFCGWMLRVHEYLALCGACLLVVSFARASAALAAACPRALPTGVRAAMRSQRRGG